MDDEESSDGSLPAGLRMEASSSGTDAEEAPSQSSQALSLPEPTQPGGERESPSNDGPCRVLEQRDTRRLTARSLQSDGGSNTLPRMSAASIPGVSLTSYCCGISSYFELSQQAGRLLLESNLGSRMQRTANRSLVSLRGRSERGRGEVRPGLPAAASRETPFPSRRNCWNARTYKRWLNTATTAKPLPKPAR